MFGKSENLANLKLYLSLRYVQITDNDCDDFLARSKNPTQRKNYLRKYPEMAAQLETANQRLWSQIYAQNGIWHQALCTLAELMQPSLNNPTVTQQSQQ